LPERLFAKLADSGLPASALQIEVTENAFLGDETGCIEEALEQLRAGGIENALDDFGTGYASLTHLRRFPVNWLKLDRSFVNTLARDWETDAIVRGVIELAHSLDLGVVAEGVETEAELDLLQRYRCDLAQGFLFAKPMPASRVPHFLRAWTWKARPASSHLLEI
jgi:EAL domain-containing protein (putative c-di-GMP-specific phosphodiesterase class I)